MLGPAPTRVFTSLRLGWGLSICIFQGFPGDADVVILYKKSVLYPLCVVTQYLRIPVLLIFCCTLDFLILNCLTFRCLYMCFTFQILEKRLSVLTYILYSLCVIEISSWSNCFTCGTVLIMHCYFIMHVFLSLYLTEILLFLFYWFWPVLRFMLIRLNNYFLCWCGIICYVK